MDRSTFLQEGLCPAMRHIRVGKQRFHVCTNNYKTCLSITSRHFQYKAKKDLKRQNIILQ